LKFLSPEAGQGRKEKRKLRNPTAGKVIENSARRLKGPPFEEKKGGERERGRESSWNLKSPGIHREWQRL